MASSPVVVIGITFTDRGANKAKNTYYCLWDDTIAHVWSLAEALASASASISDAVISRIEIVYRWRADSPPEAPESADLQRKLLVLVTNADQDINGLIIPSTIDVFETSGAYAGIRADLANPAILQLQAALADLDYRTDDDRPLGQVVAAAGLAL